MKLYYRGVSYEYNPSQVTSRKTGQPFQPPVRESKKAYNLIYRGNVYRVDPNAKKTEVSTSQATYLLIYRGISYLLSKTLQGNVTVASQLVNITGKARSTWDF
ncbi:DUF4278 domain-containing protein [Scytonema sp. NUACC26]|uniref:DUF4278 domain-containing protein n=1 Tax=Scytonema sp. NUACC26 TaxID=3140176 RepID=UPI0034DC53A1